MSQRRSLCVISYHVRIRKKHFCCKFHSRSNRCRWTKDMKMIRSSNSSGLAWQTAILSWIAWRVCTAVCPGKMFHSNSTGSQSIPNNSVFTGFLEIFKLIFPHHHSLWMSVPLSQTKNWVWVDVYFCFGRFDYFVMLQSRSHLGSNLLFNRGEVLGLVLAGSRSTTAWCRTTSWAPRSWCFR